jgi:hypothetical protein
MDPCAGSWSKESDFSVTKRLGEFVRYRRRNGCFEALYRRYGGCSIEIVLMSLGMDPLQDLSGDLEHLQMRIF